MEFCNGRGMDEGKKGLKGISTTEIERNNHSGQ